MVNIVEIHNLTKTFPGVVAVDNVSLEIREGELMTMLGPSGCGKTTTLRMIGGFEFPDTGRVILEGEDVTRLPPYKRRVNMMFQDFALFPHLTVEKNIAYGMRVAGMAKAELVREVARMLEMIELPDKAKNLPSELSNGQKQRVALARALIRRPRVLLLDEPMSALDAKLRETMQVELKHLHEKLGLTFVLVTHDQTEALVMSDRVVVMDEGRIAQVGTPIELYDNPATPYVANFLGTSNMVVAKVTEVSGETIVTEYGSGTIRVAAQGKRPAVGSEVMLCIRPEKVRVLLNGQDSPESFNRLDGVIAEQFFHGASVHLALDVGAATSIVIQHQLDTAEGQAALPPAGQRVSLSIDPASITLFEEVTAYGAEDRV
ncbi:MAG: ABC transporter ATP-binding protein [Proteobacteria bacterium]|nr:ABC transporter ATP-binding protein [Pseudomonadota bacterium]